MSNDYNIHCKICGAEIIIDDENVAENGELDDELLDFICEDCAVEKWNEMIEEIMPYI